MPVNEKSQSDDQLIQREQYTKGGISRLYWDYKDDQIIKHIPGESTSILNLGCGEGILIEKVSTRFPNIQVIGLDCIPENIDICKAHILKAELGDLYHTNYPDSQFDAVFFIEVIEHLRNAEEALQEIFQILKPGGRLIILFPNDFTFFIARLLTLILKEFFFDYGHMQQWTFVKLRRVLSHQGFILFKNLGIPTYFLPISLHGLLVAQKPLSK